MVKPCDGSGSRLAAKVNRFEDLSEVCQRAVASSLVGKALIESFVEGYELGTESIAIQGDIHVLGIMKKWMTRPS